MFDPADPPKFTEEQIIHIVVRVWDIAGNVGEEKARDIVLDKTPPTASHTLTPGKDGKVNINLGTDGSVCGVQSITRPDGSVAYGVDTLVFEVDRNGDYDFFVWDRCGNLLKYTLPVDSFAAPVKPEPASSEPEEPKPEPEPEPAPEPEGPAVPVEVPVQEDARALTLADLAMLLATNQADSIMGSLGLARSDECRTVQAVLRLEDFNGKDTLDENYAALWAALEAELSALSAQGADSAGCSYADGAITVWA